MVWLILVSIPKFQDSIAVIFKMGINHELGLSSSSSFVPIFPSCLRMNQARNRRAFVNRNMPDRRRENIHPD